MTSRNHKEATTRTATFFVSLCLCGLLIALAFANAAPAMTAQVTIMATTDLHGNILPIDYYTNTRDSRGLAQIATIISQARRDNPHLLLVDSGDTIQGTPLEYVHNKTNNRPSDPMMTVMNALHYDAMAVGNHEYNFGLQVLEKARREANFPWLSANTYDKGTDRTHYEPYLIKETNGVRVAILGLTTPGIPYWDNPQNYDGLEFREPAAEAKKWVKVLRDRERVDLVVIATHMGLEADLRTGEVSPGQVRNENQSIKIANEVPGVDVILMGHTHREVPSLFINGVLLAQANYWGRHVARVDVYLEKNQKDTRIRKGPVTVRELAGLYIYENTLVVLEVTGEQLKNALEHSAKYFRPYEPNKSASDLVDPNIPAYNYDMAEGVTYDLDITKPFGQRIQNLRFRGQSITATQKLKLATNNYRVNGGGGYTMYKDAPIVWRSSEEIREMIIDWIEQHRNIPGEPTNNWRILPPR